MDAALVLLAEFRSFRRQHRNLPVHLPLRRLLGRAAVLSRRVMRQDLAFEDPHLDPAGAVGGLRRRNAVVDIRAQRMQRYAAFAIPFNAGYFSPAEAAAAVDPDTLGAQTHRR